MFKTLSLYITLSPLVPSRYFYIPLSLSRSAPRNNDNIIDIRHSWFANQPRTRVDRYHPARFPPLQGRLSVLPPSSPITL